jgi:hypothetical protein
MGRDLIARRRHHVAMSQPMKMPAARAPTRQHRLLDELRRAPRTRAAKTLIGTLQPGSCADCIGQTVQRT